MMKILVTGATGFIGRNLKEQLSSRHEVFAPGRDELDLLDASGVASYLQAHRFDVVIHAATWNATRNSTKDTARTLENNLRMFFNLARMNGSYGKMLYFGSGQEFGRPHCMPRMKEEFFDEHIPEDPYGFSKYIMAQHALRSNNIFNLRCFGVFGKYEDWEIRFISNACCKALWDLPITIKRNVLFDYLHIDDLVRIVEKFIGSEPREKVYNVCTGRTYDLEALAKKVLKASGKELPIRIALPGLDKEYSGDNTQLIRDLGPVMFEDMDDSIAKLYAWYGARKDKIDRDLLLFDK